MIYAIIILSILLIGSFAFIFWLLRVLKNTFEMVEIFSRMAPEQFLEAYDGKYYPATVILHIEFGCESEMIITDFSMYKDKQIVGFTIYTTETIQEYAGEKNIPKDMLEEIFCKPVIFKNVIVYAPWEGMWTWKFQE